MSEFWYTVYTMQDTYGSSYQSFSLFDGTHLFWLLLTVVICVTGALLYKRASDKTRRRVNIILAVVILLVETSRQIMIISTGQWRPETLPLHLCSVNIFVCLWYAIKPNKLAANNLYSALSAGRCRRASFAVVALAADNEFLPHQLGGASYSPLTLSDFAAFRRISS